MKNIIIPDSTVNKKQQIRQQVLDGWYLGQQHCREFINLTASELYFFSVHLAASYGWVLGSTNCGYRVIGSDQPTVDLDGLFPRKFGRKEIATFQFIEENNTTVLRQPSRKGRSYQWIYRLHFYSQPDNIGATFERELRFD